MKKISSLIVSIIAALSLLLVFAGCSFGNADGGNSGEASKEDTFVGALSQESYDTADKAVEGFLATEISGDAFRAELKDTVSKGPLSEKQIGELETGDALEEGDTIVSAEAIQVTYSRSGASAASVALVAAEEETFEITIYVIEVSPAGSTVHVYHYYVPKALNGDAVTKSYYEDLFAAEKYTNCTQVYTAVLKTPMPTATGAMTTISIEQKYTIEIATDKALFTIHTVDPNSMKEDMTFSYMDILAYLEESESGLSIWTSTDGGETYVKAPGHSFASFNVTDIASLVTACLPQFDYSYFEKTSYGFKLQDGFLEEYLNKALGASGSGATASADMRFYVSAGKFSKLEASAKVSQTVNGLKIEASSEEKLTFEKFGTTTVTRPASIEAESES